MIKVQEARKLLKSRQLIFDEGAEQSRQLSASEGQFVSALGGKMRLSREWPRPGYTRKTEPLTAASVPRGIPNWALGLGIRL